MNCHMSLGDILTSASLFLNFIALCAVAYQTYLNRKSLEAAEASIKLSIKTTQIQMLPEAGWTIHVRVRLKAWIKDLTEIAEQAGQAAQVQDASLVKSLADKAMRSPKGLVSKHTRGNAPKWLWVVLISGAQYYYDAKAVQSNLWDCGEKAPFFLIQDFQASCRSSIAGLNKLLSVISDIVPEVYSNCPASLNDSDFLDD